MTSKMKSILADALINVVVLNQTIIDRVMSVGEELSAAIDAARKEKEEALSALHELTGHEYNVIYIGDHDYEVYYRSTERTTVRRFTA